MTQIAKGTFEVKLSPHAGDAIPTRLAIEKQFQGDLEGNSRGEMLAANSPVKGSAGYVAIEQVSGSLQGRSGTFVLQHSGVMTRGIGQLTISVVPDSGTGELIGLAGNLMIQIAGGKHSYEFTYTFDLG